MPVRLQRKRKKGWRLPEGAISVTRPGEFGNPFKVGHWYKIGNGKAGFKWIECYDEKRAAKTGFIKVESSEHAISLYENLLSLYPLTEDQVNKLRGKDLACFCKEGEPCHADVLLRIVNKICDECNERYAMEKSNKCQPCILAELP